MCYITYGGTLGEKFENPWPTQFVRLFKSDKANLIRTT
jgi:hypothetical protein